MDEKKFYSDLRDLAFNAAQSRSHAIDRMMNGGDPRRDINDECGYPDTQDITLDDLCTSYERHSTAGRVVEIFPNESWKVAPVIKEDEDQDTETEFESRFLEMIKDLQTEDDIPNYFEGEAGNPLWEHFRQADIKAGIGHYGIVFFGFDDGAPFDKPIKPSPKRKLLYVRSFTEQEAQLGPLITDEGNPRFGKPEYYEVCFSGSKTNRVHWTRVQHLSDSGSLLSDPRQICVWDHLLDLKKLYGGSAEMYWKGAFPGLSFEVHPSLIGEVDLDLDQLKAMMEKYENGLQRYVLGEGTTIKSLSPQVVDPTPQKEIHLEAISVRIACPKRKLKGSERGELSSTQDDSDWNDQIELRQNRYLTPRVILPFVNRMIWAGILPVPAQFIVEWPGLAEQDPEVKARVLVMRVDAMVKYMAGGVEQLVEPHNFLTRFMDFNDAEAEEILAAAEQWIIENPPDVEEEPVAGGPNEDDKSKT